MTDDLRKTYSTWLRILVVENSQQRVADFENWLPADSDVLLKPIRINRRVVRYKAAEVMRLLGGEEI